MPSVSERLKTLSLEEKERLIPKETEKPPRRESNSLLEQKISEKEKEAEQMAKKAQAFFRLSGIKLALMEINEDLLRKKGELDYYTNHEYSLHGVKPTLYYEGGILLKWKKGVLEPNYYTIIASIHGDLLDMEKISGAKEHYKTLSLDLWHSRDKSVMGTAEDCFTDFDRHFFSIETPSVNDLKTIGSWTEANIANFIKHKERADGKSIF